MEKCLTRLKEEPLGSRVTSQRKFILDYLRCTEYHPTAKMVFKEIKKKLPQISFSTVYRNLNFLVEEGYILTLKSVDNCVHYDGSAANHPHLICEKCGKIMDLDVHHHYQNFLAMNDRTKYGEVKNYHLNFYGLCYKCRKSK